MEGGPVRSKYGAIRALQQMRRHANPNVDTSVRYRSLERGAQATTMLSDLLGLLPSGHEMEVIFGAVYAKRLEAEGMSPEVMRLRDAAKKVKDVLNACRSYSLSSDATSVDEAARILTDIAAANPAVPAGVTPGDFMSSNFNGAMLAATYPNGSRWELSLRRSHPEYEDMPEGVWLLEGGGLMASGATPCIEIQLGDVLPTNAAEIVSEQMKFLHRCSGASLRHMQAVPALAAVAQGAGA